VRNWVRKHLLLSFCIVAAVWVCVLYSGVLSAPFVYDDLDQIVNNPALQSWHAVYARFILAPVSFTSGFLGGGGSTYRPLFWISLAIDRHLWGADAAGFHFTSLFLHWLNGLLLFQLLRRMKLSPFVSGLAALVWLGLPINSEAVAWISARAYLLSTAFLLLDLLAALAYIRSKNWPSLAAFIAFALLANFSHEQGMLLVALLALAYLIETEQEPERWIVLGALSLLADALYGISKFAVGAHPGHGPRTLWSVGLEFWRYVQLISFPVHMSMERSSAVAANTPSLAALIAWAALIGLAVVGILIRRRAPAVAAGLAVLLIGLLPYCGFVYIYQGMAERFVYLAAIGFVLAVVAGLMLVGPVQRRMLLGCLGIWAVWGAWRLVMRVQDWQQPLALYRNSLEATPRSAYLQENLGVALRDSGDQNGALDAFQKAVQLKPDYAGAMTAVADIYAAQGKLPQAVAEYTRSLSIASNDPKTILNYAAALQRTGDRSQAEVQYRRVMELLPRDSAASGDLESLYIEEGRLDDAIAMYKQAISINPNDASAYFDMGVMFQSRGQDREALAFYKKVLQLKPGDPQTLLYVSKLQIVGNEQ
jgi:tetratricopeptide (TPR) repeat protein